MLILDKIVVLRATKKINILTLVLSEKNILNETKKHNPPPFKLNGRSLIGKIDKIRKNSAAAKIVGFMVIFLQ